MTRDQQKQFGQELKEIANGFTVMDDSELRAWAYEWSAIVLNTSPVATQEEEDRP